MLDTHQVGSLARGQGPEPGPRLAGPVIFYDGECGLCDRFVQFVLRHDRLQEFRFAPLQGETFQPYRAQRGRRGENTVVLADEAGLHLRSDAALRVLGRLGFPWSVVGRAGRLVPRWARDLGYRLVARVRLRLFGQVNACLLPGSAPGRFLP